MQQTILFFQQLSARGSEKRLVFLGGCCELLTRRREVGSRKRGGQCSECDSTVKTPYLNAIFTNSNGRLLNMGSQAAFLTLRKTHFSQENLRRDSHFSVLADSQALILRTSQLLSRDTRRIRCSWVLKSLAICNCSPYQGVFESYVLGNTVAFPITPGTKNAVAKKSPIFIPSWKPGLSNRCY